MSWGTEVTVESGTVNIRRAAALLGIGRAACYEAARQGRLPSLRSGNRFRIPIRVIERILDHPEQFNARPGEENDDAGGEER